jgi:hypothetical protein
LAVGFVVCDPFPYVLVVFCYVSFISFFVHFNSEKTKRTCFKSTTSSLVKRKIAHIIFLIVWSNIFFANGGTPPPSLFPSSAVVMFPQTTMLCFSSSCVAIYLFCIEIIFSFVFFSSEHLGS